MLVMCLVGMFAISPKLALICLAPMSLITVVFAVTGPAMHRRSLAVQDQLGVVSSRAQENFSGQRVVRAFVQEDREVDRFRVECDRYLEANLSFARLRGTMNGLMTLLAELAIVATLFVGGRGIIGGTMSEGDFAAFTAYQFMLVWPMIAIGWTITLAQRGLACLQRIAELMDEKPDATGGTATADFTAAVEFRDLTFRYDETREPALRGVSFSIPRGATVAIVGRTGAGKSTLAALLTRLYPAPPGTVFIDGRDVNDLPADAQRRAVGCVPQDPFLFSDTIRENIAFGVASEAAQPGSDNGSSAKEAAVNGAPQTDRAAALSRIAGDAERFPQKLDQMIGERGVTLSGGQKQRTALARAIVRDPSILILDDALSSVDAHTEREILDELRGVMKGRTCIVITHRLAVARLADRVIVLDSGEVSEIGTHDDLVRSGKLYAKLWTRQQLLGELAAEDAEDSEKDSSASSASSAANPQ
jgi:ATP-binding cassette subfamily B protein